MLVEIVLTLRNSPVLSVIQHCTANERRLCLFLRACPVCAAAVPLCLNRLLPAPLGKVGRHCLTFNLSVVRKDFISRI